MREYTRNSQPCEATQPNVRRAGAKVELAQLCAAGITRFDRGIYVVRRADFLYEPEARPVHRRNARIRTRLEKGQEESVLVSLRQM